MAKYFLSLLAALFLILGCGACSRQSMAAKAAYSTSFERQDAGGLAYDAAPVLRDRSNLYGEMEQIMEDGDAAFPEDTAVERKLVKRAAIRMRVENLAAADSSIVGLMEEYGAYAASTVIEEDSRRYSIRVPSQAYDDFIAGTGGMGRILSRSENAEDVTLRYYDLEGRLATKSELLKTFQAYLGKARNIEEILSVEARIAELQSEIDGTGRELRGLVNRVDYATIDLTILGPVASTPYRGPTLAERIQELFSGFGGFLSVLAVVLVGIVIYGIPTLLLLVLFFWLLFGRIGLLKRLWRTVAGKK